MYLYICIGEYILLGIYKISSSLMVEHYSSKVSI